MTVKSAMINGNNSRVATRELAPMKLPDERSGTSRRVFALTPAMTFQTAMLFRSNSFKRLGVWVFWATGLAIFLTFMFQFVSLGADLDQMSLSERVLFERTVQQNPFSSPFIKLMLVVLAEMYLLLGCKHGCAWCVNRTSSLMLHFAGVQGHQHALFLRGQDLLARAKCRIEYHDPVATPMPLNFGRFWRRLAALDLIVEKLHNYLQNRFVTPRRTRLLDQAAKVFDAVDPGDLHFGQSSYLAGLIYIRGFQTPRVTKARSYLESASAEGVDEAKFELGILLGSCDAPPDQILAIKLLEDALSRLRRRETTNRALLELANLLKDRDLDRAQGYLIEIDSHDDFGKLGNPTTSCDNAQGIAGDVVDVQREARMLAREISGLVKAAAERKLACVEREKREAIEGMMALFAHKFRGPVDSILFNTEHHHDEKVYADAAHTMNGLLDIFSVVSTTPEKLASSFRDDSGGEGSPAAILLRSLKLALMQLLSNRNRLRMSPHYLAYAKNTGLASSELRQSDWMREKHWVEKEIELQTQWEEQIGAMMIGADLQAIGDWMATHLLPLEVKGFRESGARFAEYGPKASLLTVVLTEVLVNAIKHTAPSAKVPLTVSLSECAAGSCEINFSCDNPSTLESRRREKSKGSGRGHKFLALIAEHLNGRFMADVAKDDSRVSISLPKALFQGDSA